MMSVVIQLQLCSV